MSQNLVDMGITGTLPKREGWTQREIGKEKVEYDTPKFSRAANLADLSKDFVLFTHAALFVYGNWTRDPVAEYVTVEDNSCEPFWVTFDKAVLSGLDFNFRDAKGRKRSNRDWNYCLMGCPRASWDGLLEYLQTLSGVNYQERRYHVTVVQKIPMVDYFAMAKKSTLPNPLPMVDLYTVGLLSNDQNVYFEAAGNPPIDRVRIRRCPPFPQIIAQAEKVLDGNFRPLSNPIYIPFEANDEPEVLASVCS